MKHIPNPIVEGMIRYALRSFNLKLLSFASERKRNKIEEENMRNRWKTLFAMLLCGVLILGTIGLAVGLNLEKKDAIQNKPNYVEKISPELAALLGNTSGELPLVVLIREPQGMKSVDDLITQEIYDRTNNLSKLGRSVKEKMESIEKGEKIDQRELDREKTLLKEEEENLTTEINGIRRTVIENNKQVLEPVLNQVAVKLQNIAGVKIVNKEEIVPAVAILADVKSIESIKNIPEVVQIILDTRDQSDLDVSIPTIKANLVWGYGDTGSGVRTAVEDTGISGNSNVVVSAAYSAVPGEGTTDLDGHGTNVSGIIASRHPTYRGAAYDVYLMNAKVADATGSGQFSWTENGTNWAINNGAVIISRSRSASTIADDGTNIWSKFADYIVDRYDVIWVNSIGNNQPSPRAPGGTYNVIGVGATDDKGTTSRSDDTMASFSPSGPTPDSRKKPDVAAPGTSIYTTTNSGGFANVDGTSFAALHVTGITAQIKYDRSSAGSLITKAVIINSAEKRGFSDWNSNWGWGYVDADRAWWDDYKTFAGTVGNGASTYATLNANAGDPITVTLTWKRHMTDTSTVKGYSDLDLYVYSPSGSLVGSSLDGNDNVEQVGFTASQTGTYQVRVYGYSVPSAVSPQGFVLAANKYFN